MLFLEIMKEERKKGKEREKSKEGKPSFKTCNFKQARNHDFHEETTPS